MTSLQTQEPSVGRRMIGALTAEVIGTYILVLIGAGTVVAVTLTAAQSTTPNRSAISIAFGLAVLVAVYLFIHVSGAHINPTVTIGLVVIGKFPWRAVPAYLVAQLAGGLLAALSIWTFFGNKARSPDLLLGATLVGERGWVVAAFAEVILGFL